MDRSIHFSLKKATQVCSIYLCALIVSCSSVKRPEDLVEQYLDEESLVTISRMTNPIAFYRGLGARTRMDQMALADFAYLAPFEVNHMGNYKLYLWAAFPIGHTIDPHVAKQLVVQLDYDLLTFKPSIRNWQDIGVEEAVYETRIGSENGAIFELAERELSLILDSEEIYLSAGQNGVNFSLWNEKPEVNTELNAFLQLIDF